MSPASLAWHSGPEPPQQRDAWAMRGQSSSVMVTGRRSDRPILRVFMVVVIGVSFSGPLRAALIRLVRLRGILLVSAPPPGRRGWRARETGVTAARAAVISVRHT